MIDVCSMVGVAGAETSSSAASVNATAIDPNATLAASPGPGTLEQVAAAAAQAAGEPANATTPSGGGGFASINNEGRGMQCGT
jgi:hypothetical protein